MTTGTAVLDLAGSTGDKARWAPIFPTTIRFVALLLNAIPGDAGVVKGDIRPTFGSDTNRGDGDAFVINLATSHVAGGMVYKEVNVTLQPGQELVVECTDASASVSAAKMSLWVETVYDRPLNNAKMVAST